ncbi:MAG: replicative DNA helicase [Verrucomicrobia bacterium]|nr:replicative DNA helicase [Verrucomicrobiota bacterium]
MTPEPLAQNIRLDKVPPHDLDAEMAALGCALIDRESLDKLGEHLQPEMFYHRPHQTICRTLLDLYERRVDVDFNTVAERLRSLNVLDEAGGAVYLTDLIDRVSTTAHIDSYIRIVRGKYLLRSLITTSTEVVSRCYTSAEDPEDVLDEAEKAIFDIAEKKVAESFRQMKPLVAGVVDTIERLWEDQHYVTGVPSGFHDLDELTSGFQYSDMVIIAARPSIGKTALALRVAEHCAVDCKIPVAIFSLEMSAEQLTHRLLCSRARMNAQEVRRGIFKKDRWPDIVKSAGELTVAPIYINDTPGLTPLQIRAIARRLKATHDIGLVVVDYLQLMSGGMRRQENRQQEISEISRSLKGLARELRVPVIVCSQLNREVEQRPGRRPQLSDLRESGAIEQDADVVMLLSRPEFYDPNDHPGMATIILAKQRNGPTGAVDLAFLKEYTRFEPLAQTHGMSEAGEAALEDAGPSDDGVPFDVDI